MRKALEARRDAWQHTDKGYLYRGGGDYLLRHGRFFSGEELGDYEHLKGPEGNCFENALHACEADPSLHYYEGVYAVGGGHYTPHAWCVTDGDRLLEVTFPTDPEVLAMGRERLSKQKVLPLEHWGYWGVEFDPTFAVAYWTKYQEYGPGGVGHVGILDRPSQDTDPGSTEWREDWPIYSYPYDARRTEP